MCAYDIVRKYNKTTAFIEKYVPNSVCENKSSSYTKMTFELCDVMMLATADLPRIYYKTSQLYVIYNIYFSALIFSGNGNGHVTSAGGKYGFIFRRDISIDQNCVSNRVGRNLVMMIFFSKKITHYGYEK